MSRSIRSANAEFQVLEALRTNRQKRNRENAFIVEGVRNVDAALAHAWPIRSVLVVERRPRSPWAEGVCGRVGDVVELPPDLFAVLTDRAELPEVLLVAEKRARSLDDIPVDGVFVATVLDRPTYPGNIGTILRTCDALGSGVVLTIGHGADPYDPQSVRASTGSFFAVAVVEVETVEQLTAWAAPRGVTLVATDESGPSIREALPAPPLALLMGNETLGLSRSLREAADVTVAIPMRGTASSLNVAAAHAVALYAATSS